MKHFALFTLLSFTFLAGSYSQTAIRFPAQFYKLKTNGERAAFLRKAIGDSVTASAYRHVPEWSHEAIRLATLSGSDSLKPMLYQFIADAYETTKFDSAAYYYRKSLSAFKKIPLRQKVYLEQSLIYAFTALDKKDSTLFYIHELEKTVKSQPDTSKLRLKATNTIASSYGAMSQYADAIRNYRFVIRQGLIIKDSSILLNGFANIGMTYGEMNNDRMAAYYTRQALPYLGDDTFNQMVTYSNLSGYYATLKMLDSAKYFLSKAEVSGKVSGDEYAINSIAIRRAAILITEKKYQEASVVLDKTLDYWQKQPPGVDLVNTLLAYYSVDSARNNYKMADQHLLSLYSLTKSMNTKVYEVEALRRLPYVKGKLGDYQSAFRFQTLFIAMNDSIQVEKAKRDLAELQTEYLTTKKEEQIKLLQKEAVIKDLKIEAEIRNKTFFIILTLLLVAGFGVIFYVRQWRNKITLQNLKSSLEMKALRSQMNPHFIFNSLNSIQKYIWEDRREDASEYLTKFARLIRLVLENSLHTSVKLSEELSLLRLYVEMEHRRNNQKFDYSITVAENIDAENTLIPPLLLQPYVENAIWHGLSQKDEHGKLEISIEKTEKHLICRIEDDGIGRVRSAEIKENKVKKTSLALNISSQRIAWLQKESGIKSSVEIIDKHDSEVGTIVILTLPLFTASGR